MWKRKLAVALIPFVLSSCGLMDADSEEGNVNPGKVQLVRGEDGRTFALPCLRRYQPQTEVQARQVLDACEVEVSGNRARGAYGDYYGNHSWYWNPYWLWLQQPGWCNWLLGWRSSSCLPWFGYQQPQYPWYRTPTQCPSHCLCGRRGDPNEICPMVVCRVEELRACGIYSSY